LTFAKEKRVNHDWLTLSNKTTKLARLEGLEPPAYGFEDV